MGVDIAAGAPIRKGGPLFAAALRLQSAGALGIKPPDRVASSAAPRPHGAEIFALGVVNSRLTSSDSKRDEALSLGAHRVVNTRSADDLAKLAGSLNAIISTVNVSLDWNGLIGALAPKGKLHTVGAVLEPIAVAAMPIIMGQRSLSGSPTAARPHRLELDLPRATCRADHKKFFPMSNINEAFKHSRAATPTASAAKRPTKPARDAAADLQLTDKLALVSGSTRDRPRHGHRARREGSHHGQPVLPPNALRCWRNSWATAIVLESPPSLPPAAR